MPLQQHAYPVGSLLPPGVTVKPAPAMPHRQARRRDTAVRGRPPADRQSACLASDETIAVLCVAAGKCREAAPRVRDFGANWVTRTRLLLQRGTRSGKFLAIGSAVVGLALVAALAYLLVFLIPVLIFGAFVAAILAGLGARR